MRISILLLSAACALLLSACGDVEKEISFPERTEIERQAGRGKLTGDGLTLGGGDESAAGTNPLGVNSFLWRATLDTLAFMPLASADPFGGVVITDWYEDPNARGERFKVTALILDRNLRADGINVSLFKQEKMPDSQWIDVTVPDKLERDLEDTILTRARELKVRSIR